MAQLVCMGATIKCSFGLAPGSLVVLPVNCVLTQVPAATIMDHIPMENVMPFGMCTSPENPEVIAETAAALGVPTPAPCIPNTVAPWVVGAPTVMIKNMPALDNSSKLMCIWGGIIQVVVAGQTTTMVP